MDLARQIPVSGVATEARLYPGSVWPILRYYVKAALFRHWAGALGFIRSRITNSIVKALNSKIKMGLKRAYGFKTFENYRTSIYPIAGKLELPIRCWREPNIAKRGQSPCFER